MEKSTTTKKPQNKDPHFVVHKHDATHLHYDLRLEIGGVLASWAAPKGIPRVTYAKRLAIKMPDHPLWYRHFKGVIPEGQYGAGTVEIWDKGSFRSTHAPEKNKKKSLERALQKGILELEFFGEKMKGRYALIYRTLTLYKK